MSPELAEAHTRLANAIERHRKHQHSRWCAWCDRYKNEVLLARAAVSRLERPTGDTAA